MSDAPQPFIVNAVDAGLALGRLEAGNARY